MPARTPRAVPLLALGGFVCLLLLVMADWPPVQRLDGALSEAARRHGLRQPGLVAALRVATDLAAPLPYLVGGAVATVAFARRGHRPRALFCGVVTAVVPSLWGVAHWLIHRPRPVDGFVTVASNGFPSGHASNASAAALAAVLLAWPLLRRVGRIAVVLAAVGFAGFIAVTRVALLAHWPSDVLGGGLLAVAVVTTAAAAVGRTGRRSARYRRDLYPESRRI